ncbi:CBS domain protein [Nitrosotalea sinensis]|jgi:CBS domain-containing protein|uniref:CBS domain protein n=1 Tax=Nitrosotalea sinensis TaxID=1499975 RepID=A0A2H1EHW1_9ARCH|nr:CBS domain-containing protein [Candidatus Nitrosotalea sinensis]SHO46520.1 CBS domain protein [Candidatus Nitrosotalea sinensis]
MSSPQVIYQHLKDVRELKVAKIMKKPTILDSSFVASKTIGVLVNSDSYDAFCMEGKDVLTISARELLGVKDIESTKIRSLLRKIQPLSKNDTIEKAAAILSHYRMRSVPVVERDEIVGIVNGKDIVELLHKQDLKWISANTILTADPITANSSDSIATARKIMTTKRIDHLPIVKNGKVTQVLTSMHLLQVIKPGERLGSGLRGLNLKKKYQTQIGNIGSTRIPNLNTNAPLSSVIESMLKNDTSCCLLSLWGNIHGIITYKDIINILESKIPSEVPLYIVGLPEDYDSSEIVKTKFDKIIRNLSKVYPEVEQAKASIKTIHNPSTNRPHYQVAVRIASPYRTYNYTESGWDLSKIFDAIGSKVVRNLSQRSKKRWKTTIRKVDKKDIF